MRRVLRWVSMWTVAAVACLLLTVSTVATYFFDVDSGDWYATAVEFTVEKGLLAEATPGRFNPDGLTTRAMFYTVLYRAEGETGLWPMPEGVPDIESDDWYLESASWALANGIANTVEGKYLPDVPITRAEVCRSLLRYDGLLRGMTLPTATDVAFLDLYSLDAETREAVTRCCAAGLLSGNADGTFDPLGTITRAEFAELLWNYFSLPGQPALADSGETVDNTPTYVRWTGDVVLDFPLSAVDEVTEELVLWLNQRIIAENYPASVVGYGMTIDGNSRHLTNYGDYGYHDCYNVATILYNQKNDLDPGVELYGQQQYYGYALQVDGILTQDVWHQEAQDTGKDPWQCTWWAWGRAAQYLDLQYGLDLAAVCDGRTNLGNGRDYYRNLSRYFLSDMTPSANSFISWTGGEFGHVAYLEAVDENGIWVSAADAGHAWRGVTYIPRSDNPRNPYPLYWHNGETCNGFNHLDYTASGAPISTAG